MAIEVNGVTLPDIPAEVLAKYPYAYIVKEISKNGTVTYNFMASQFLAFIGNELLFALTGVSENAVGTLAGCQLGSFTDGDTEWTLGEEISGPYMYYVGTSNSWTIYLIWANTDIYELTNIDLSTGQYQLGGICYRALTGETEYRVPEDFLVDIANKIRRTVFPVRGHTTESIQRELTKILDANVALTNYAWIADASIISDETTNNVRTLRSYVKKAEVPPFLSLSNGESIRALDLPNAEVIGYRLCSDNKNIKTVHAPNAKELSYATFENCTNLHLTGEEFPNLSTINHFCFSGCTALENLRFPMVRIIGASAFQGCSNLVVVDLGSVEVIYNNAFYDCPLRTLILRKDDVVCQLDGADFLSRTPIEDGQGYIYVPAGLLSTYQTAAYWSSYAAQFRALEDYTVDGTITGELDESKI